MARIKKNKPTGQLLRGRWFPLALFVLFAFLIVWDIAEDLVAGTTVLHIVIELLMMVAALVGAAYYWKRFRTAQRLERTLKRDLEKARADTAHWHEEERELLVNLKQAVNRQFTRWDFSPTDREIAYYLLKGLSMKEIARLRDSTDRSVKQQAYVLYHKAGLGGRAELSAYFLGGLLHSDAAAVEDAGEQDSRQGAAATGNGQRVSD